MLSIPTVPPPNPLGWRTPQIASAAGWRSERSPTGIRQRPPRLPPRRPRAGPPSQISERLRQAAVDLEADQAPGQAGYAAPQRQRRRQMPGASSASKAVLAVPAPHAAGQHQFFATRQPHHFFAGCPRHRLLSARHSYPDPASDVVPFWAHNSMAHLSMAHPSMARLSMARLSMTRLSMTHTHRALEPAQS